MKKQIKIFNLLILCCLSSILHGQMDFSACGFDKNENKYIVGTFSNVINCGNHNLLSSYGETDIYICKYDVKGTCLWATKIGGKLYDDVGGIYVEPNGIFYLTGTITGDVRFGEIKKKSNAKGSLFLAKYNTSGDPIWIKISDNKNGMSGNSITGDGKGNVFVTGTVEGAMMFDGVNVYNKGKTDICVIKVSGINGTTAWAINVGGKNNDNSSTIYYSNNKILVGGNSVSETNISLGYLAEISASSGTIDWVTIIGKRKGNINKITSDISGNYYITGNAESALDKDNLESFDFIIGKINAADGKEMWLKRSPGNNAAGSDIVCDAAGNLIVTGNFSDSLRIENFLLNGFSQFDIFLAKYSASGMVSYAKSFGDAKKDFAKQLVYRNNKITLFGTFSNSIVFEKQILSGKENTVFSIDFDLQKNNYNNPTKLIESTPIDQSNDNISNLNGKLLKGEGKSQTFISEQEVSIKDEGGRLIKHTTTDENGDFSFKNIDLSANLNLVLEKNDNLKSDDKVFLAQQNGIIIQKIEMDKDKQFISKMLPSTMTKLEKIIDDDDPGLKMKGFKTSPETQFVLIERILYEPGSYMIPADAVGDLSRMATYLKQNQKIKLEIISHTDAIGDDESNMTLSAKRANEVKDYLVKKGIPTDRISSSGLGETKILNRCLNGVTCTELEHSYNRRTEFKFVK